MLVLAGTEDRHALPADVERLSAALGARARTLVIRGGGHLSLRAADRRAHDAALLALLEPLRRPSDER